MPEATMDENHLPAGREDKVWFPWKVLAMQSESVPEPVDQAAQCDFRTCVFAADAPHVGAALFGAELVHAAAFLDGQVERKI